MPSFNWSLNAGSSTEELCEPLVHSFYIQSSYASLWYLRTWLHRCLDENCYSLVVLGTTVHNSSMMAKGPWPHKVWLWDLIPKDLQRYKKCKYWARAKIIRTNLKFSQLLEPYFMKLIAIIWIAHLWFCTSIFLNHVLKRKPQQLFFFLSVPPQDCWAAHYSWKQSTAYHAMCSIIWEASG